MPEVAALEKALDGSASPGPDPACACLWCGAALPWPGSAVMHSHGKPDLSAPNLIQHGALVRGPPLILQCKVPN
jgi:hypothetical protein